MQWHLVSLVVRDLSQEFSKFSKYVNAMQKGKYTIDMGYLQYLLHAQILPKLSMESRRLEICEIIDGGIFWASRKEIENHLR